MRKYIYIYNLYLSLEISKNNIAIDNSTIEMYFHNLIITFHLKNDILTLFQK